MVREELRPRAQGECVMHPNPVLNRIARTPIWLPFVVYLPLIGVAVGVFFWRSDVGAGLSVVLFGLGWLTWTLTEYIIHRFLYHTYGGPEWLKRIRDRGHWQHHRHPKDPYCLAMPVVMSLLIAGVFLGVAWFFLHMGALVFWAGMVWGYLVYLWFHYAQHRYSRVRFFKKLWRHHVLHHYKNPDANFGVSTRLWDIVFGTELKG